MNIGYVYDDGGRAAAGFSGDAGDCVTRAIAIAAELPYADVYAALSVGILRISWDPDGSNPTIEKVE